MAAAAPGGGDEGPIDSSSDDGSIESVVPEPRRLYIAHTLRSPSAHRRSTPTIFSGPYAKLSGYVPSRVDLRLMLSIRLSQALGRSARGAPAVTLSRRFSGAAGGGLSFQLTDDQAAFKQAARDFAKDVIIPQAAELDRTMKVH